MVRRHLDLRDRKRHLPTHRTRVVPRKPPPLPPDQVQALGARLTDIVETAREAFGRRILFPGPERWKELPRSALPMIVDIFCTIIRNMEPRRKRATIWGKLIHSLFPRRETTIAVGLTHLEGMNFLRPTVTSGHARGEYFRFNFPSASHREAQARLRNALDQLVKLPLLQRTDWKETRELLEEVRDVISGERGIDELSGPLVPIRTAYFEVLAREALRFREQAPASSSPTPCMIVGEDGLQCVLPDGHLIGHHCGLLSPHAVREGEREYTLGEYLSTKHIQTRADAEAFLYAFSTGKPQAFAELQGQELKEMQKMKELVELALQLGILAAGPRSSELERRLRRLDIDLRA